MKINAEFEVLQHGTQFVLIRNGKPIQDEYGQIRLYQSISEAALVAQNWELYRAPTFRHLRSLSDMDLKRLAGLND